jgi:hypothetical protein
VEEFGLTRIREIVAGFQSTRPEPRCGCQLSCSRKLFTLQSWRSDAKNKNEVESGQKNGFAFFQVTVDLNIDLSIIDKYRFIVHLFSGKI